MKIFFLSKQKLKLLFFCWGTVNKISMPILLSAVAYRKNKKKLFIFLSRSKIKKISALIAWINMPVFLLKLPSRNKSNTINFSSDSTVKNFAMYAWIQTDAHFPVKVVFSKQKLEFLIFLLYMCLNSQPYFPVQVDFRKQNLKLSIYLLLVQPQIIKYICLNSCAYFPMQTIVGNN
jgi:hypothetical protein